MSKLRDLIKSVKAPAPPRSKQRGRVPGLVAERCNRWLQDRPDMEVEDILPHANFLADQVKFHFCRQFSKAGIQAWRVRPSGQKCTRDEGLKKLGHYSMSKDLVGTFFAGDFAEAYGITIGLLAGAKLHSFQQRVRVPAVTVDKHGVTRDDHIHGSIDALLDIGKKTYLIDYKSASSYAFQNAGIGEDVWGYHPQLQCYMMSPDIEVDGGILVYINKENWREFKEVVVDLPTEDDKLRWYEHCFALSRTMDMDSLPEKPQWATIKTSNLRKPQPHTVEVLEDIRCKLCGNKDLCHGEGWYLRPGGKKNEWIRAIPK